MAGEITALGSFIKLRYRCTCDVVASGNSDGLEPAAFSIAVAGHRRKPALSHELIERKWRQRIQRQRITVKIWNGVNGHDSAAVSKQTKKRAPGRQRQRARHLRWSPIRPEAH